MAKRKTNKRHMCGHVTVRDGSDVRVNKATFLEAVYQTYGSNSCEYAKARSEVRENEDMFFTKQGTYEAMRMYGCTVSYLL